MGLAMVNEDKRAELEDSLLRLRQVIPSVWWQLYQGCLNEGFTEDQAMDLVREYVGASSTAVGNPKDHAP